MANDMTYPPSQDEETFRNHNTGVFAFMEVEEKNRIVVFGKFGTRLKAREEYPNAKVMVLE